LDGMDTGEETEGEMEALVEFKGLSYSFEESRMRAGEIGKWVNNFEKRRMIAKRTRVESNPSPECPRVEVDDSGYEGDREMGSPKRVKGFWR
jgi:hypothetical protein